MFLILLIIGFNNLEIIPLVLKVNLMISELSFTQTHLAMKFGLIITQLMGLNIAFIQWMEDYCNGLKY